MKRTLITLTLTAAAIPAAAQYTGTRINRNAGAAESVSKRDPESAVRVANSFAQCIARREGKSIKRALDLPLASADQMRGIYKYVDQYDECLGKGSEEWSTMETPPLLLAGGAAEYFVNTDYKTVDLATLRAMSDEAMAKAPVAPRTPLEDLGLCMVRRDPGRIRVLLGTKPTSSAEKSAAKAMAGDVGACVPRGQSLSLATPTLRAVVAYAAYRAATKMETAG